MKTAQSSSLSIIDALTAGLRAALARPWLIAITAALDLGLWLSPQLAINNLVQRFLVIWEAFFRLGFGTDQASAAAMITSVRESMTQLGQGVNLADLITSSWFSMPSAVATIQSPRLMLISDVVMAPFGLGVKLKSVAPSPWQGPAIEINSFWVALLIVAGLWLCSQFIAALILRTAASAPIPAAPKQQNAAQAEGTDPPVRHWSGGRGWLALTLRLAAFSVLLTLVIFCLYLPLSLALLFVTGSAAGGAGMVFAMIGGLTLWMLLWLLTSLFFMSEALIVDGQPFVTSIWASFRLTRQNGLRTLGLIALVNVILLGFRAVWGLAGQTPAGALVAIFGNAYLVTAMLLAVYAYFGELKQREADKTKKPVAGNNRG